MANLDAKNPDKFTALPLVEMFAGDANSTQLFGQIIDTIEMTRVAITLNIDTRELSILPATFTISG